MLTLYWCNSKYLKGKYKHGEKKQAGPKKLHFSLLIFSDRNNIAKLVGDISGNCFNICQLL